MDFKVGDRVKCVFDRIIYTGTVTSLDTKCDENDKDWADRIWVKSDSNGDYIYDQKELHPVRSRIFLLTPLEQLL